MLPGLREILPRHRLTNLANYDIYKSFAIRDPS